MSRGTRSIFGSSPKVGAAGHMTTRQGHCAHNPSGKDQLYPEEIQEMAKQSFSNVNEKPCNRDSEFKETANKFDDLIAGWTRYWNDVLKPVIPLTPNIVKAIIATESSFDPTKLANKKNKDSARGLMQITNEGRKILGNEKGEIKDHYVTATREELNDPSINICAGIRWLFRKQAIASSLLNKNATWDEAVAEYKGTRVATKERAAELMERYAKKLGEYNLCGKV